MILISPTKKTKISSYSYGNAWPCEFFNCCFLVYLSISFFVWGDLPCEGYQIIELSLDSLGKTVSTVILKGGFLG